MPVALCMYYRIERTYLTDADGRSDRTYDLAPYMVSAEGSTAAAIAFITSENGKVIGSISTLAGDRSVATGIAGRRVFVLFVQRGIEAMESVRGAPERRGGEADERRRRE